MKYDKIEKIGNTTIQHGKNNNRIYLMKLDKNDYPAVLKKIKSLAKKNQYTKIFAKIPKWAVDGFKNEGYIKEGHIPKLYNGKTDAFAEIVSRHASMVYGTCTRILGEPS